MKFLLLIVSAVCVLLTISFGNAETLKWLNKILVEATSDNNSERFQKSAMPTESNVLIINNTKTYKGQLFYNWFYANWNTVEHHTGYFLTIQEKVVSRQRSILSIAIDECSISTFFLNEKDIDFDNIGSEQIETVRYFLKHPESISNQIFKD